MTVFPILAAIISFLVASPAQAAEPASLSLSPTLGTFNKGCTFTVDIKLDTGGVKTNGSDVILIYDPTRLAAEKIEMGPLFPFSFGNKIDNQSGKAMISGLSSADSSFKGSGNMATVNFKVLDNALSGPTTVRVDFDPENKSKTTDSNVVVWGGITDILGQVNDSSLVIGTGSCKSSAVTFGTVLKEAKVLGTSTNTPAALPQSGDILNTLVLIGIGSLLIVVGILGLALL